MLQCCTSSRISENWRIIHILYDIQVLVPVECSLCWMLETRCSHVVSSFFFWGCLFFLLCNLLCQKFVNKFHLGCAEMFMKQGEDISLYCCEYKEPYRVSVKK